MMNQLELDVRWEIYSVHARKLNEFLAKGYEIHVDGAPLEVEGEIVVDGAKRIITFKSETATYPMYDEADSETLENIAIFFREHVKVLYPVDDWAKDTNVAPGEIVITKKEHESLLDDANKLQSLECAGVDNWSGYDDAMKIYRGEEVD